MSNWNVLISEVESVIKKNGRKEITGQILQDTLRYVILKLGENATFKGIADQNTIPGTQDGKVFYFAITEGVYPNFSGVTVNSNEIAILSNVSSTQWIKQTLKEIENDIDFSPELGSLPVSFDNDQFGYFDRDGIFNNIKAWKLSNPIPVTPNLSYKVKTYAADFMASVIVVDANGNYIDTLQHGGVLETDGVILQTNLVFIPDHVEYIAIGSGVSAINEVTFERAQPWIEGLYNKETLELTTDWKQGEYVNANGDVTKLGTYQRSNFIEVNGKYVKSIIVKGTLSSETFQNNVSFYDNSELFISGYQSPATAEVNIKLDVPINCKYIRLSNLIASGQFKIFIDSIEAIKMLINKDESEFIDLYIGNPIPGYIDATGKVNSSIFVHSEYIPISGNSTYTFSGTISGAIFPNGVNLYSFYSDKTEASFISGLNAYSPTGQPLTLIETPIQTPSNAKYIRLCTSSFAAFILIFKITGTFKDSVDLLLRESARTQLQLETNLFGMPNFLDSVISRNNDIFIDGLSGESSFEPGTILLNGTTLINRRQNVLSYNPAVGSSNQRVTFNRVDKELKVLYSQDMTFRPVPKTVGNGTQEKNICICGDSLVASGYAAAETFSLLREDNDFIFNEIGTITSGGASHEGRQEWQWSTYINPTYGTTPFENNTNAFMINGELNFQSYMQNNFPNLSRQEIDYFVISLGTNDVTKGVIVPSLGILNTIIANAKVFIDALISADKGFPNCKVAIGMPSIGAPLFPTTERRAQTFRKAMQLLNQLYVQTFDNGKYNSNVTCVLHGAYIDRYDSFDFIEAPINDYVPNVTVRQWTNGIEPSIDGYKQWGRGYYGKLRAFLDNKL